LRNKIPRRDHERHVHTVRREHLSSAPDLARDLRHLSTVVEMRIELDDDLLDSLQFLYERAPSKVLTLPGPTAGAKLRPQPRLQALDVDVQPAGTSLKGRPMVQLRRAFDELVWAWAISTFWSGLPPPRWPIECAGGKRGGGGRASDAGAHQSRARQSRHRAPFEDSPNALFQRTAGPSPCPNLDSGATRCHGTAMSIRYLE